MVKQALVSTAVAALALAGISAGALAADLRVKTPVFKAPPPVAVYDWTGFYVGGHAGYGWTRNGDARFDPIPDPVNFGIGPLVFNADGSGGLVGGQIGYNRQLAANWVLGVELDLSSSGVKGGQTIQPLFFFNAPGVPILGASAFMNHEVRWFGTVRGRLGYAWDRWLIYVTAGVAYGETSYTANLFTGSNFPLSTRQTQWGGTAGGGIEYAIAGTSWSVRGEYLYVHLDGHREIAARIPPSATFAALWSWDDTRLHVARIGVNYKWGGPVVAKF